MRIKGIVDEDFVNYMKPSMFIAMPTCTFKCEKESGVCCCQNSHLAKAETIDVDTQKLVKRYIENGITKAVVFGGLEPFDSMSQMDLFIKILRTQYRCYDDIVIYTGYTEYELDMMGYRKWLSTYRNIIVKFGRFVPDSEPRYDDILGVTLQSSNQYAKKIS